MLELTQEEKQVVKFLLVIFIIGIGIKFLAKAPQAPKALPGFNRNLGKVNLNNASHKELMDIKGVGQKLAERIVFYRQEIVSFKDVEELKEIKGITKARFQKIKEQVYIDD